MIIKNGATAVIAAWAAFILGVFAGDVWLGWLAAMSILLTYAFGDDR